MKYGAIIFFFFSFLAFNHAQDEDLEFTDKIYLDYIHTVQLRAIGSPYKDPVVMMGTKQFLWLSFDDFSEEARTYVYTIQHCNADWTPSDLTDLDYISGLMEGDIDEYDFSTNTLTPYTYQWLLLPNDELRWTLSGNYLLKVYDAEDDKKLAFTRRFMVLEPSLTTITPEFISSTSNYNTHQEINFEVAHDRLRVDNPQREIKVAVRQNRRWDNAIFADRPRSENKQTLIYNTRNKFSFGGAKEFRYLDLRSVEQTRHNISQIIEGTDTYDVTLFSDEMRSNKSFLRQPDMNGDFVIANSDQTDRMINGISRDTALFLSLLNIGETDLVDFDLSYSINFVIENLRPSNNNKNLRSDYADVLFSLNVNQELEDYDVYLSGQFNNWQLDPRYKMIYNDIIHAYVVKPKFKQGVYDYMYTVVPKEGGTKMDLTELEGHWYETENDYTISVYYRPFGARYDRLVGFREFNTIDQNRINNR